MMASDGVDLDSTMAEHDIHAQQGLVWIPNHPTEGWAVGRTIGVDGNGDYEVADDSGEKFVVKASDTSSVDTTALKGIANLLDLGEFSEGSMLHSVRTRYLNSEKTAEGNGCLMFTAVGHPILISVNPYANLDATLFSDVMEQKYRKTAGQNVPPHLFAIADAAYTQMLTTQASQSIIVSGESGAGKTEATKRILRYLANVQRTNASNSSSSSAPAKDSIERQVLDSNPVLEAFGNAKTLRNDNSSRFGKFIDINFDVGGKLTSAKISNYLLERCRIITQAAQERNYHFFYQLCSGASADEVERLRLLEAHEFEYTAETQHIDGVDDAADYDDVMSCMKHLAFTDEEIDQIHDVIAAVLHLGNFQFFDGEHSAASSDGDTQGAGIKSTDVVGFEDDVDQAVKWLAVDLLQIEDKACFYKVFSHKSLIDPFSKKVIFMPQDMASASVTRQSMAKSLYAKLFDWLVKKINAAMQERSQAAQAAESAQVSNERKRSVGPDSAPNFDPASRSAGASNAATGRGARGAQHEGLAAAAAAAKAVHAATPRSRPRSDFWTFTASKCSRQILRAALHQLRKRVPARPLQFAHVQPGTEIVRRGTNLLATYFVRGQPGDLGRD